MTGIEFDYDGRRGRVVDGRIEWREDGTERRQAREEEAESYRSVRVYSKGSARGEGPAQQVRTVSVLRNAPALERRQVVDKRTGLKLQQCPTCKGWWPGHGKGGRCECPAVQP